MCEWGLGGVSLVMGGLKRWLRGKWGNDLLFERLVDEPKLDRKVYSIDEAIPINTNLARRTSGIPVSLSAISLATPAKSSGESSLVKASLNVIAAVARSVEIAPAAI